MPKLAYRSPLAHAAEPLGIVGLHAPGLRIVEKPFQGILELRGDLADPAFAAAVTDALGAPLPAEPLTSRVQDGIRILWSRPDGWLLCGTPAAIAALEARLRSALAGTHHTLIEVGHRTVAFELAGPTARLVLAKGMTLDLHARAFPAGRVARSLLAGQRVLLHATRDEPGFDLYVDVSMARLIWDWFRDAALEFQV